MKKFLVFLLAILLASGASRAFADRPSYVEGDALVIMDASSAGVSVASSVGAKTVGTFSKISSMTGKNFVHLRSESKTTAQLIEELKKNPAVKSVQPNYIRYLPERPKASEVKKIPHDPDYSKLWGMKVIGMPAVWNTWTGNDDLDSVCVAIIDTGIDYNHPDLIANMAIDSTGKHGRLFKDGGVSLDPMDHQGHGTHVAGTIGAVGNNGIGVTGVNWRVKLLAVNVFGSSKEATTTDQTNGMEYILEQQEYLNIRVVNMSVGGWDAEEDEWYKTGIELLSDAGIIVAVAAGNEEQDISNPSNAINPDNGKPYRGTLPYPAAFDIANMITVGATDNSDEKGSYSNYSPNYVDIAAPGSNVYSTVPGGGYAYSDGTSMATPHVAGAAALLSVGYPDKPASEIKKMLLDGGNKSVGAAYWQNGRLDVAKSFGLDPTPFPEPEDPVTNGGGGGGCNGAFTIFASLLLIPFVLKRK